MILRSKRYEEIEKAVIMLFKNIIINKFPIDCFDICRQLGIILIPYSALSEKKKNSAFEASKDGFNVVIEISKGLFVNCIYYNDAMPKKRIRFTIMHELGHLNLGHTEHSDLAESEANHFAKYSLAPPPLVHNSQVEDYVELAAVFELSKECAFYAMKNYTNWVKYGSPKYLEHEMTLISLFQQVMQ